MMIRGNGFPMEKELYELLKRIADGERFFRPQTDAD
jgi:hypothetical protein